MILESGGQHNSRRRRARLARRWQRTTKVAPSKPATLEEILVTYKLQSRRGRKQNFRDESIALRDLAKVMANSPSKLIDKLLETALELCSAGTAGLSLLETTSVGGWRAICMTAPDNISRGFK